MLDCVVYLISLALFGILGVLDTQYLKYWIQRFFLQKFQVSGFTLEDNSAWMLDAIPNVLGSFLMGWFGITFKSNIHHFSKHLAIGLSTGYLGGLANFSGLNQRLVHLASKGRLAYVFFGTLQVMCVTGSIFEGVDCALLFKEEVLTKFNNYFEHMQVNNVKRYVPAVIIVLFSFVALWSLNGALAAIKHNNTTDEAILWMGCLVAPFGVWTRWYLARLNGRGIGRNGSLRWFPVGTLSANIIAACLMASLPTLSAAVDTKIFRIIISSIEFGFIGCLSNVATVAAETYAMRESGRPYIAFFYLQATFFSFLLGAWIYSGQWPKYFK